MGRGSSGGAGAIGTATTVTLADGTTVDLTNSPLKYGANDPSVAGALRTAISAHRDRWVKLQNEHFMGYTASGIPVGAEIAGGKSSAKIPYQTMLMENADVHSHPRSKGEGVLGGSFSETDLDGFVSFSNLKTRRVEAAEGTYSISKQKGFDLTGFKRYYKSAFQKCRSDYQKDIINSMNKVTDWKQSQQDSKSIFNKYLVSMHNALMAGQKQYNYSYTLERPK